MKTVVRKGVFETNSSSTHSLSICGHALSEIKNTKITLTPEFGEFGWQIRKYDTSDWKLTYLMTAAAMYDDVFNEELILNDRYWKEKSVEQANNFINKLNKMLTTTKITIKEISEEAFEDPDYPFGYIDHQSSDVGYEVYKYAMESTENLIDYLFSDTYVTTDNDNH